MVHHNTVFTQMLKFIPTCLSRQGHKSESLAHQYHSGRRLRKMTRWTQFVSMATNLLDDWLAIRIGSNTLFSIATVFSWKITKHCLKHLIEDLDYYRTPAFASGSALINCPGITLFE